MTRGKPSPELLSPSDAMLPPQGNRDTTTARGEDARNCGDPQGLPEVRAMFAEVLGPPREAIVPGNDSSLALMAGDDEADCPSDLWSGAFSAWRRPRRGG